MEKTYLFIFLLITFHSCSNEEDDSINQVDQTTETKEKLLQSKIYQGVKFDYQN